MELTIYYAILRDSINPSIQSFSHTAALILTGTLPTLIKPLPQTGMTNEYLRLIPLHPLPNPKQTLSPPVITGSTRKTPNPYPSPTGSTIKT